MKNILSFGEGTIFEEGYGFSPKKIMRDPTISIELKGFYAYISSYTGNGKTAWPGTKRIMQELGIGKELLFKLIKEAQEKGLIKVEKVRNNKGQFTNNQYSLVIEPTKAQLKPCPDSPDTATPDTAPPYPARPDTNSNIDLIVTFTNSNSNYSSSQKPNTTEYKLAELLKQKILDNHPTAKVPRDLTKWAAEIERAIRIDKRDPAKLAKVISWGQSDPFWRANILSAKKLREKYDTLYLQMERGENNRKPGSNSGSYQREVDEFANLDFSKFQYNGGG